MARMERVTELGFYHIINRGVEQRDIFLSLEDYDAFLDLLVEMTDRFNIILHSFCLMTNHYHLVLQTHEKNISEAIQFINVNYSKYFNKKYKRVGHLWQGRFKSYYLYDDLHCWSVIKYCERNPIKANMVQEIGDYKYQSFYQWKNKSEYFELLNNSMIFDMTLDEYEHYISSDIQTDILEKIYTTPKIIKIDDNIKFLYKRLETFFEDDKDINRNKNIIKAHKYGYSKTEIANFTTLAVSSIAYIVSGTIRKKNLN
ncbi:MAG: transposase [Campylobacterota bacterium]|nr:transposase [Campylobacterota bacterium]